MIEQDYILLQERDREKAESTQPSPTAVRDKRGSAPARSPSRCSHAPLSLSLYHSTLPPRRRCSSPTPDARLAERARSRTRATLSPRRQTGSRLLSRRRGEGGTYMYEYTAASAAAGRRGRRRCHCRRRRHNADEGRARTGRVERGNALLMPLATTIR